VVFYLDDILILAQTPRLASSHCLKLKGLLERLGFSLNLKKSELTPVQSFTYLGLAWDSVNQTVALPPDKRADIQETASRILASKRVTSRTLQRFLGKANFACIAVPHGRLMCRPIQRCVLKGNTRMFQPVSLPPEARQAVRWWAALKVSTNPLWFPETSVTLTTDASCRGWGASLSNKNMKLQGTWPPHWVERRSRHINETEMRAVLLAVHH
jgi:hypothetical protein